MENSMNFAQNKDYLTYLREELNKESKLEFTACEELTEYLSLSDKVKPPPDSFVNIKPNKLKKMKKSIHMMIF